ncbi:MAG TPA: hypothetical protein VF629_10215 [Hymenobacter sp.]|jgi:hypothetical protein|uniref:hypothetical protein n=1 Tax=Hymenobacter sp. TaxID=1898978 RepID=UPI002EDBA5A2
MSNLPVSAYPRAVKMIFAVYSIGFLVGTYTHSADLLERGLLAHPVPLVIGVFWNVLTLLDPLTVVLLWWRPTLGIRLALAIMVADICVNTHVYLAGYFGPPVPGMVWVDLFLQALFGLFIFVTAPLAYQLLRAKQH